MEEGTGVKVIYWGALVLPPDGSAARGMMNEALQERLAACGWKYYETATKIDFDFRMAGSDPIEYEALVPAIQGEINDLYDGFEIVAAGDQLFVMWVSEDRKIHTALLQAEHWPRVNVRPVPAGGPWREP